MDKGEEGCPGPTPGSMIMVKSQALVSIRFNVPPNTLQVILGRGFYGSNDPTNSVRALKEDRVL